MPKTEGRPLEVAPSRCRTDAHARLARVAPTAQAAGGARRAVRLQRMACWHAGGAGWADLVRGGLESQTRRAGCVAQPTRGRAFGDRLGHPGRRHSRQQPTAALGYSVGSTKPSNLEISGLSYVSRRVSAASQGLTALRCLPAAPLFVRGAAAQLQTEEEVREG